MAHRRETLIALLLLPLAGVALVVRGWFGECAIDCYDQNLAVPVLVSVLLLPCWMVAAFLVARPRKRELRWLAGALFALYAFYAIGFGLAGGDHVAASTVAVAAVVNALVWRGLRARNDEGPPVGGPSGEAV